MRTAILKLYGFLLGSFLSSLLLFSAAAADESIQVTVVGTLKTGIVAIGGETTGSTITANKVTWELDFGKNEEIRAAAEKLNGQQAKVTGMLEKRAGVEVKERWIVTVSGLTAAEKGAKQTTGIEAQEFREGTTVALTGDKKEANVDIHCERGIDSCYLVRSGETWPKEIVLKLHLRGLESLKVSHGNSAIEWSVASTGDHAARASYYSGKRVAELTAADPLFSEARLIKGKEGASYFQVAIPAKPLESNPPRIKVQWIDFYR